MRDDSHRWDVTTPFVSHGVTLMRVAQTRQHLVSGTDVLRRYADVLVSWPNQPRGPRYALSLRRDRVLLVGDFDVQPGFDTRQGVAVSDVSDGFDIFDLAGPGAMACLARGAEVRLDQPSRSVARLIFGIGTYLYRAPAVDGFRVHVPRAMTAAFMRHVTEATSPH